MLRLRDDFYATEHPQPTDVLMIIEVAGTSIELDRQVKLPLYGEARIPEAIIIALADEIIEVHAEPENGRYRSVKTLR